MSSFTKPLKGEFLGNNRFELGETFVYYTEDGEDTIEVPVGFISDGASIPRIFWTIIGSPWSGKYAKAAVIHDFLYVRQFYTRKKSDLIFLEGMKVLGVSWWKRKAMYWAVRIASGIPWNKYKEMKDE